MMAGYSVLVLLFSLAQVSYSMEQAVRNIILQYLNISSVVDDSTIKDLINNRDKYEQLPIHLAAHEGRIDVIKAIVQLGGEVNIREGPFLKNRPSYGKTALLIAAERGDEDIVEYLLSSGADPNIHSKWDVAPIHVAAEAGHLSVIKLLLEAGVDINTPDSSYKTALFLAAKGGYEDIVEYLLSTGADPNIRSYYGAPIHAAAEAGHLGVTKLLIQAGVYINARGIESTTALYLAAEGGYEDIVEYLLSIGADPNILSHLGAPIHAAAKARHLGVIKLLLQAGADINEYRGILSRTALHLAVEGGDEDIVKYLLSKHADMEVKDHYGDTGLHLAARSGKLGMTKLLLEGGAYIYALGRNNKLALHLAADGGDDDIMEYLFSKHAGAEGINLQQKGQKEEGEYLEADHIVREILLSQNGEKFRTFILPKKKDKVSKLIHYAAKSGRFDVVKALLRLGADANPRNSEGKTPLHLAAQEGIEDIVKILLSKHADVHIRDNQGDAPIHLAMIQEHFNVTKTLLESGVDPNVRGSSGQTPLHIAVRRNNENMVDLLLSKNADPGVKTKWNATPLEFAIYRASETIAIKLLDSGAKVGENSTKILNLAIEKEYLDVVKYLILHCGCIGGKDENDLTPLNAGVLSENKVAIKLLLEHGVNTTQNQTRILDISSTIEITNVDRVTGVHNLAPLHLASNNGQREIVEMLISYGASVNITDECYYTSLHYATENGHTDIVKILTSAGADKDAVDTNGTTPLHIACRKGLLEIIRLLISKPSASLDIKDRYRGYTPLHEAVWNEFNETVKLLLDTGADKEAKDKNGQTALSLAVAVGNFEIVKILINGGAKLFPVDINGLRTVDIAVREGFPDILDLFQKSTKTILYPMFDYSSGYFPIHYSVAKTYKPIKRIATESDKLETTRILLKMKYDVNSINQNNLITPLHIASRDGFPKIVKFLLSNGADTQAVDKKSWIPLQYGASNGHNDVVLTILNFRTDKAIDENYLKSSLLLSSKEGHYKVVQTFLEFLVDPDSTDITNRTALHFACSGGYKEIVRLILLSFGSTTLEAKDKWGWSPLNYAASWRGHEETVEVLSKIKLEKQPGHFDIVPCSPFKAALPDMRRN